MNPLIANAAQVCFSVLMSVAANSDPGQVDYPHSFEACHQIDAEYLAEKKADDDAAWEQYNQNNLDIVNRAAKLIQK